MSFKAISENKIFAKISGFTVAQLLPKHIGTRYLGNVTPPTILPISVCLFFFVENPTLVFISFPIL